MDLSLGSTYEQGITRRQNTETFPSYEWNKDIKDNQASFPHPYTPYTYATRDTVVGWGRWRTEMPGSYKMPPITQHFKTRQRDPLFSEEGGEGQSHIRNLIHCAQQSKQHRAQHSRQKQTFIFFYNFQTGFLDFFFLRWIPINSIGATAATENVKAPLLLLFALFFFVSFSSGFSFKPLLFFS